MSRPSRRVDCLVVGTEPEFLARAEEIGQFTFWKAKSCPTLLEYVHRMDAFGKCSTILISCLSGKKREQITQHLEKLNAQISNVDIVVVMPDGATKEEMDSIFSSGAGTVLLESEYLKSARPEFLFLLLIRGQFFPFEAAELFSKSEMLFDSYHLFQNNKRPVPVIFKGAPISDRKFKRLSTIKNLYVKKSEIHSYREYVEKYYDISVREGIMKRAQACLLEFMNDAFELRRAILFESDRMTTETFTTNFERAIRCLIQFGEYLSQCPDPWGFIAEKGKNDFTALDRSYSIALLAIHIAKKAGVGRLEDLAGAAVLHLLGIWDMKAMTIMSISKAGAEALDPIETEMFRNHPSSSARKVQKKNFDVSNQIRAVLTATEERFDGKGTPNQLAPAFIPIESFLLALATEVDEKFMRNQLKSQSLEAAFVEVVQSNLSIQGHYPPELLNSFGAISKVA